MMTLTCTYMQVTKSETTMYYTAANDFFLILWLSCGKQDPKLYIPWVDVPSRYSQSMLRTNLLFVCFIFTYHAKFITSILCSCVRYAYGYTVITGTIITVLECFIRVHSLVHIIYKHGDCSIRVYQSFSIIHHSIHQIMLALCLVLIATRYALA